MKGGGIVYVLVNKAAGLVGALILIFMVMIAVVGPKPAATLAGTTAVIGGQSTGIVFGGLPTFFKSIKDGQGLIEPNTPDCTQLTGCDDTSKAKAEPKKKN